VKHSDTLCAAATRLEAERVGRALDGIAKGHSLVADEPREPNPVRQVLAPLKTPASAIQLAHGVCALAGRDQLGVVSFWRAAAPEQLTAPRIQTLPATKGIPGTEIRHL
jgi:hypothetical protein